MFKRIMSVMLAVVMLMAVAVVAVSAAEAGDKVYIKVDSGDCYAVNKGDVVVYEYALACDKKVSSLDCTTYFDAAGLKFVPDVDEYGDYTAVEFPNFKAVSNFNLEGRVVYNFSDINGVRFPVNDSPIDKNIVFKGAFEVTAESGTYNLYTELKVLGDNTNNKIVFDGVQVDETATVLESGSLPGLTPVEDPTEPTPTEPTPTEPTPTEPTETEPKPTETEPQPTEPTTVEPTDDPTEAETTPAPATKDQSSTTDNKKPTNSNTVKTGTTAVAIAFITVVVMAAGVVMFSRKKISE